MGKKVILDCDPGMDDAVAIMMAAKSNKLELLAVTTVSGNYPVDITTTNALKIMELLGYDSIPVARGMDGPMTRRRPPDPFTHGEDGLACTGLPMPSHSPMEKHAVLVIADIIRKYPGEVTIISTGPMSNIAMAMRLYPDIVPFIKEIVAISGCFGLNQASFLNATGDTPQSEWNVYVDPEAAKIVYSSDIPIKLIGLDIATDFKVDFSKQDIDKLALSSKKTAWFLSRAINFVHSRGFGAYCAVIDCMAVAATADDELVKFEKMHVGVDSRDGITLGMTIRDGRHHFVWEKLPYVNVAIAADYSKFLALVMESMLN